ncbi:MAG TPA: AAA family ATPase [Solirubrobacteraceae bacterium]|nr:AAA family ATPase [Solirubrobacteraceae bacterium]
MLAELQRHPHARSVLAPALRDGRASHAYLFHGPAGSGKRALARALAAELLAEGAADPASARARVASGAHPDLTWVVPSGAHEMLVGDIAEPVIAAASRTPFEARKRVFVIERVDELGEEAANRMLKTLEEPASFVHLMLLTDRLGEVLPTIRSRCQLVRLEAPSPESVATGIQRLGVDAAGAAACVALALGDADRAAELASADGRALRAAAEAFARAGLSGQMAVARPWQQLLAAARGRGAAVAEEFKARFDADRELTAKRDQKRLETDYAERGRRAQRRAQTAALDLGLQIVSLWYADLAALAWDAEDLVRNVDRRAELAQDAQRDVVGDPARLRAAIEAVEATRLRFASNVTEELACEALGYRIEQALGA